MFLSHLLTTVGEISCSRDLMPVSFLGKAMSMLMFPVYGSWKKEIWSFCGAVKLNCLHVPVCENIFVEDWHSALNQYMDTHL